MPHTGSAPCVLPFVANSSSHELSSLLLLVDQCLSVISIMTGALSVLPIDLALSKSQSKSSKTFLHELINKLNLPKQLFVHGFLCVSYFGESKHE